jgi:hypothetical protein
MGSAVEEQRTAAAGEAVMGFGMAAMAVPAATLDPPGWVWPVYAAVFAAAALRSLWAARSSAHHLHHAVGALAMVHMALAMTAAPAAHAGHGVTGLPVLTGVLLVYFAAYVLVSGARLLPSGPPGAGGPPAPAGGAVRWGDRPELARACRLGMGIAMLAMLLTM